MYILKTVSKPHVTIIDNSGESIEDGRNITHKLYGDGHFVGWVGFGDYSKCMRIQFDSGVRDFAPEILVRSLITK